MNTLKTLVINRKKWGTGDDGGYLRNDEGKMCCLGFACRQLGYAAQTIDGQCLPAEVIGKVNESKQKSCQRLQPLVNSRGENKAIVNKLVRVNDSTAPIYKNNPKRRESRIAELFKTIGVKVQFTN